MSGKQDNQAISFSGSFGHEDSSPRRLHVALPVIVATPLHVNGLFWR